MKNTFPLSVIIHTKNSSKTLKACLESVKFAEQIVVVDMESSDNSVEIAHTYTDDIFSVKDSGYVETVRNFGIGKATENWILLLDADEEISDGLKIWLESFLTSPQAKQECAFQIPRKNYFFEQELRHTGWWPDYQLRFFKKGMVKWNEEIHAQPNVICETKTLPADPEKAIIHHNYASVEQFFLRLNHYTTITALEKPLNKAVTSAELTKIFSDEFIQRFFKWQGFQDGALGLSLSFFQATYQLLTRVKQWESAGFMEKDTDEQDSIAAVERFHKDLRYWIADWKIAHTSGITKFIWMIRRKLSE